MLQVQEFLKNLLRQLINFIIENIENVNVGIAMNGNLCVILDYNSRDFTDMVLQRANLVVMKFLSRTLKNYVILMEQKEFPLALNS